MGWGKYPTVIPIISTLPPSGLFFRLVKTKSTKSTMTGLTFGGLIASLYNTYGERNANGVLRLAIKTNLVVFRGPNRYVVSRVTRKA